MDGLSNVQIDRYLKSKLVNLKNIRSQSYEEFFTPTGSIKHALNPHHNYAVVLNMDRANGPGNHWVALIIYPALKQLYYYDSLLPNKEYVPPAGLRNYLVSMQKAGWDLAQNAQLDQKVYTSGKENIMCGAYSIGIILIMDAVSRSPLDSTLDKAFFDAHQQLKNDSLVTNIYRSAQGM